MLGDIVYRIYGVHARRSTDKFFGAFSTAADAEAEISRLRQVEMHGLNWSDQYHNGGFVIRETIVQTDFEIPSRPKPRDRYFVRGTPKKSYPGAWATTDVVVYRRSHGNEAEKVCEYTRNYSLLQTFEPFRQGERDFALISHDYTGTSVLDLATGQIIAQESGFCPVGFYVPDWWDVHNGLIIPGSESWNNDYEWSSGQFGFVWGCVWGDDDSWKVQYLDLSEIQSGVIRRDERFGYVELATQPQQSACFELDEATGKASDPPSFIKIKRRHGKTFLTFSVDLEFDFESGQPMEWQRLRIANFE